MDEPIWQNSAEEYRAIQGLSREGRYQEALERAVRALQTGNLGRKHAARLNSLVCWLYTEPLHQACPTATLHGEEAVRLADLVRDEWIRCEALARLVHSYCHMGDTARANSACEQIAVELERNSAALEGGPAALWVLRATVAAAEGDDEGCLAALDQAAPVGDPSLSASLPGLRTQRISSLAALGRQADARQLLEASGVAIAEPRPEWDLLQQALFALDHQDPGEARRLAYSVVGRALSAGRIDLDRRFRRLLGSLL